MYVIMRLWRSVTACAACCLACSQLLCATCHLDVVTILTRSVGWLVFWLTAVALVEPAGFVVLVVVDAHDVDRSVLPFEHLQPLCETKRNAPFA